MPQNPGNVLVIAFMMRSTLLWCCISRPPVESDMLFVVDQQVKLARDAIPRLGKELLDKSNPSLINIQIRHLQLVTHLAHTKMCLSSGPTS